MTPQSIGLPQNTIVLGKHSGKHALEERLAELGFILDKAQLNFVFEEFKKLTDKKKDISDRDLQALVESDGHKFEDGYRIDSFIINTGNKMQATASVVLCHGDEQISGVSLGSGPVDAGFTAINTLVGGGFELEDYSLHSVTEGEDALGESVVRVCYQGRSVVGRGASTDVIEASLKAYINGVNRALNGA
jgi:2-isopropylmalate synthase